MMAVMALAMVLPAGPAAAQPADGAACATIPAAFERLACYDAIFRPGGGEPAPQSVMLVSEQQIPARPNGRDHARLRVVCDAGTLSVRFAFAGHMVSITGRNGPLTLQFDQSPPATSNLAVSPDNTEIGYWTTPESRAFIAQLVAADGLRVRITPNNFRSLQVDFRLGGQAEALTALSEACT
jgi:hypothetical protein